MHTHGPSRVRIALCAYCREPAPSNPNLDSFVDRSANSEYAQNRCIHCGYPAERHRYEITNHLFKPGASLSTDLWYCGCKN